MNGEQKRAYIYKLIKAQNIKNSNDINCKHSNNTNDNKEEEIKLN